MVKDYFPELISELCQENNINLITLQNDRIRLLSLNGLKRMIWSKKFELNSVTSTRIADNKSSTYNVLNYYGIPCVEYKRYTCYYQNGNCCLDSESIMSIDNDLKYYHELVLKPDNGYEGTDVYRCTCIDDVFQALKKFEKPYTYICSSPYYSVKSEYRTICLNGEALLSYKKNLPFVIGNGRNTVQQLVLQKYDNLLLENISSKNIREQILPPGEQINIGWKFNLSQGSTSSSIIEVSVLDKIQTLSLKAASSIHIKFASVDIIETIYGDFFILEINSGVVLNHFIEDSPLNYNIAKNIYEKAILAMFTMQS